MTKKRVQFIYRMSLTLGICFFKNAWFLGFWLNPFVTENSLLSTLAALDQPYHNLFIFTEVFAGLLFILLGISFISTNKELMKNLGALFMSCGFLTAIAALIPYLDFGGNTFFIVVHSIFSGLSISALLFAIFLSLFMVQRWYLWLFSSLFFGSLILLIMLGASAQDITFSVVQKINTVISGVWVIFIVNELRDYKY